ncbi:unnamed protein product [Thelazia callipaeda]|uniref:Ground-like domain-containing protein n=1 Tax=Thelazia callipaeda TaxID=103827 RepID=A0A0N5D7S2_THECL|nr:unnamed protein product [Thelazia callipaeda]
MKSNVGRWFKIILFMLIVLMTMSQSNGKSMRSCKCPPPSECKSSCWNETVTSAIGKHHLRRREVDTREEVEIIDEQKCNSGSLQKIMLQNMANQTVREAKTKIMRAAEALLGGYFNVICSHGDFSYITTTTLYCLQSLDDINCYAFLAENSRPN